MTEKQRIERALDLAGCPDGEHHLHYIIDQMVRALTGCPVIEKPFTDYNGTVYNVEVQGESEEYEVWVAGYEGDCTCGTLDCSTDNCLHDDEDDCVDDCECDTYEWDVGIPC